MKYLNKTIPLTKLIITPKGVAEPLCNDCKTRDCSHPIEKKQISVFGINKEMKILNNGLSEWAVIDCQGYSE